MAHCHQRARLRRWHTERHRHDSEVTRSWETEALRRAATEQDGQVGLSSWHAQKLAAQHSAQQNGSDGLGCCIAETMVIMSLSCFDHIQATGAGAPLPSGPAGHRASGETSII